MDEATYEGMAPSIVVDGPFVGGAVVLLKLEDGVAYLDAEATAALIDDLQARLDESNTEVES